MKRIRLLHFFWILTILGLVFPVSIHAAAPKQETDPVTVKAQDILNQMTPEERVGQLFLVTFTGPEAATGTADSNQIYRLIVDYHIGGVVLNAANDNFVGSDQTIPILISLTDQLQRDEYIASQTPQDNPSTNEPFTPIYVPLFIAIDQAGDGYPYDQIYSDQLTVLPSEMSIGATWQPSLAAQAGAVLGQELSALGFNMLLGPSLDVLELQYSTNGNDLGVRTFGGDPFWVGEMGSAFITGVHQGSANSMVVIAKHFPGYGGSDRLPEEEVATVRRSLEQLKQFELIPFFKVTGNAADPEATADGLLVSHIRYQGFQGNIRSQTKPVSFDSTAFSQLVSLPPLDVWRQQGGVMVSDNLGSRAVRRFYDPTGETFNGRLVALDAFLAGNDLLYLGDFLSSGDPDNYTSVIRTLASFTLKYREDAAFAQRVDESVMRILERKLRLYGNSFALAKTLPSNDAASQIGKSSQVTFDIARQAATLISPSMAELDTAIPGATDRIVFVSDTGTFQQCSRCAQRQILAPNALEQAVIRLYSPQAGGPVPPRNLISYTFQDLKDMIDSGRGQLQIENDLKAANWIVFSILNVNTSDPTSYAMRDFLNARPDLIQGKHVIAFALNAPYFLDATEISKLTAFYGLYSRSPKFIEVAARLLFHEIQPTGNLPVSVPGVGYDLKFTTLPDPDQTIQIFLDIPPNGDTAETPTPEAANGEIESVSCIP